MLNLTEMIELLKEGKITKEQMLEQISKNSFQVSLANSETNKTNTEASQLNSETISFAPDSDQNDTLFFPATFEDRQTQWSVKKKTNLEALQEHKIQEEIKDCTFQPKTNYSPRKFSENTLKRISSQRDYEKYKSIKQEQEYNKLQEELAACTFNPVINKFSGTGTRYLGRSRSAKKCKSNHSFTPQVKGAAKHMRSAREYLKRDPFERLSQGKAPAETEEETAKCSCEESPGFEFTSKSFFERQALYELKKNEKRESMQDFFDHQPVINEKSRKIVKKSFSQRIQEKATRRSQSKLDPSVYTFHPQITDKAKMMKFRSFDSGNIDLKKVYPSVQSNQSDQESSKTSTPTGARKKYLGVRSKLQVLNDPAGYVERIKNEQRVREFEIQCYREDKIKKELEECTHHPVIIDAPGYVKQIARNMAMLRAEMTKKTPLKPEWK